jgi:hypothetical protein
MYDVQVTTLELEQVICALAREDIAQLLKEYARVGYKVAHGREDEDFEVLWGQIFDAARPEEKPRD